ncbi:MULTISPECIES: hypothetical protein [unclassified Roseivivax]|uniref:hypothetical protein n=1 Tax=Roseivivax sp. GX 12232 TaxID=2900547 RepID=UPI001E2B06B1|nr:hypothetical protein [Roseivivax sp. GX 12232]MCE0506319.1 hypothetical protein [Roseivivax sp. GX 12232]
MFKRIFTAGFVLGAAALAPPAWAQSAPCMPRDHLVEALEETHSEVMVGNGLQSPTSMIEIWSSPETGSFTIFITNPNGLSCVVSAGRFWTTIAPEPGVAS